MAKQDEKQKAAFKRELDKKRAKQKTSYEIKIDSVTDSKGNKYSPSIYAGIKKEQVNHPSHYGGKDNVYEAIKVIHAWDLGFDLGNTVKYISRAGKKDANKEIEDLEKAEFYLKARINVLKEKQIKK
jgi:hypothetical protein